LATTYDSNGGESPHLQHENNWQNYTNKNGIFILSHQTVDINSTGKLKLDPKQRRIKQKQNHTIKQITLKD